ncbi:D-glucosaminate-6-phosphate ammonia lyase [subsurface metagenome]
MSVYSRLGVNRVINASFCLTFLGGSTLTKEVTDASLEANRCFVAMRDLDEKVGEVIAGITGAEAAHVTSGAYCALALSTAACIAGSDPDMMSKLPDTRGMKNEVLIQANLRTVFDRAVEVPGGKRVLVGDEDQGCTPEELEGAITEKTAAIEYLPQLDPPRENVISLEEVIEIGHRHDVPIIVDAAGQTYPTGRLKMFVAMGADLVCYSGKYFGGPNSTGFVCGRKELMEAVKENSFIGSHRTIGRGYKLDRQEIVALVVALQRWMEMDHIKERLQPARRRRTNLMDALWKVPGVTLKVQPYSYHVVGLQVTLDKTPDETAEIVDNLRNGDPAIWVRRRRENTIMMNTLFLDDGNEKIIVDRVKELLSR